MKRGCPSLPFWQVQIQGWASDLEHLAKYFTSSPYRVLLDERDVGFLYESDSFVECTISEEVLIKANAELRVLSGVLKIARDSREPLRAGAVYKNNAAGGRDVFVHISDCLEVRVEFGEASVTVTDSQGNVAQASPPPRTVTLAQLAATDCNVGKVMRLFAAEDSRSWVALYRIHEVIEADVGGEHKLIKQAWGSPEDLKRFKHSANSVTVAGDHARHGRELEQPPKKPMTPEEAIAYLNYVAQAWLASKGV